MYRGLYIAKGVRTYRRYRPPKLQEIDGYIYMA